MSRWLRCWLLGGLLCGLVAAAVAAEPGVASTTPVAADASRQVLVLLNLPAAHFRADGNYSGGYADSAGSSARRRIARELARAHGLGLATSWPLPLIGVDCYVLDVPPAQQADSVAEQLGRDPRVEWVQPMNVFRALGHDDPLFNLQPAAREWALDDVHTLVTGRGIRVAVVDSAVQLDHPDLLGQIGASVNFVGGSAPAAELHGTGVAGIIAARADNRVGSAGVAPQATVLALRACWQEAASTTTLCSSLSLARALSAAVEQGAQVINLSLSGPPDRLLARLIEAALARGLDVVAAVDRAAGSASFPAAVGGVVAVIDQTAAGMPAGTYVAPGTDVPTTLPVSRWATVSGASYAAAQVSGLLALLREAHARAGATGGPAARDLVRRADARIDVCASLQRAGAACACAGCGGAAPLALTVR